MNVEENVFHFSQATGLFGGIPLVVCGDLHSMIWSCTCKLLCHVWSLGWSRLGVTDTSCRSSVSPECGQELSALPARPVCSLVEPGAFRGGAPLAEKGGKNLTAQKFCAVTDVQSSELFQRAFHADTEMGTAWTLLRSSTPHCCSEAFYYFSQKRGTAIRAPSL